MRKVLLAATVLLISVAAHADPAVRVAQNDPTPVQPAVTAVEPAKAPEPAKASEPTKTAEPAPVVETKPAQISKPKRRAARRESDSTKLVGSQRSTACTGNSRRPALTRICLVFDDRGIMERAYQRPRGSKIP